MNDNYSDVLVVGAGPAGLTLACDLQRRGISHRIISAAPGGFDGSRAKGIQPRTLEVLDDLGVLPYLEPHSTLYPKLGLHIGPIIVPKTMIKIHERTEDVPYPNTLLAAQYDTDAALRARLDQLGGHVDFDTRLTTYTDGPDGVTASLEGPHGVEEHRARFLIGADGGGSTVRLTSGISFDGTTDDNDRVIVADLTIDGLSRNRWHAWPRSGGRNLSLCPLPGGEKFQFMLKLRPEEKADLSRDAIDAMVKKITGKAKLTVQKVNWASVWRPNIRIAGRYRLGNVFLIGDAAHVHPPTGAQGMNTGIQDAYNLGWKLGQVLSGTPEALLDTYEAERQPVAARVLGLSSEIYARSNQTLGGVTRGDEERQLRLSYAGGPLAPESAENGAGPSLLRAGDRAPDARYRDGDGHSRRIHDAIRGTHFTLIAVGDEAIEGLSDLSTPERGARLVTVAIQTTSPGLAGIYGITGPTQILVRPDGYIAYLTTGSWRQTFQENASRMLPATDTSDERPSVPPHHPKKESSPRADH